MGLRLWAGILLVTLVLLRLAYGWFGDPWNPRTPKTEATLATVWTWHPSSNCDEGFSSLKIYLQPAPDTDHDVVFVGCGRVLSGPELLPKGEVLVQ